MADDDEIDVLGDFNVNLDLFGNTSFVSQNSELLNCDYTIHPQWLLDKPSANPDNWYDSSNLSTNLLDKNLIDNNENVGHVSTENSITDESGWTEKEKNLLERGIEIFGKSNIRLAQFVGTKTASEVKYYLKNFYMENHTNYKGFIEGVVDENNLISDVLNDTQIPASIEEVIATVSTAKPTILVSQNKKSRKKSASDTIHDIPSGQSLLKKNYFNNEHEKAIPGRKSGNKKVKFRFKTKLKMPLNINQKKVKIMNEFSKKTQVSKVEITTGKGLAVPLCEGEEIIKIQKMESDTDEDVDIDIEDINEPKVETKPVMIEKNTPKIIPEEVSKPVEVSENDLNLLNISETTKNELTTLDVPKSELILDKNVITELEKVINNEFFEGRQTKTPIRYLKIRNHILDFWLAQKPLYVTKTSIRQGLKNCGDVNCISRIHYFLEQIGAINFGCEQVCYARPLSDMLQTTRNVTKVKPKKDVNTLPVRNINEMNVSRVRNKKKFLNDGEGGYTLTHNENGDVINTTIVNEDQPTAQTKQRITTKKPAIRLIYCRQMKDNSTELYSIKFGLSTLLTMDYHAHTSLTEVMGLIAGHWCMEERTLVICHYEPCKNIASSATHCDMCPISQAKAAESIHSRGMDILGWFHSHPTFAPEPSQQDLETQQMMQQWIGGKNPCIGVILTPFSSNGALISSPYRCLIVEKEITENLETKLIPYKFNVNLLTDGFNVEAFLSNLQRIVSFLNDNHEQNCYIDFKKPYFQDTSITYLEKYISSVRMFLAKCGDFNKMTCDGIIEGIKNLI